MASITQTAQKTWRVYIRKRGYATVTKTFEKKGDAVRWASLTEADMVTGKFVDVHKEAKTITVEEIFKQYLEEMPSSIKEPKQQAIKVNALIKSCDFMSRHLDQISPRDIQDWRDKRLKKVAKSTVNRDMNTLSGVFSHAIEEWRIPLAFNPVHQVKRPPNSDVKRDRRWEQSEIDAVLTASGFDAQQKPTNLRAYAGWAIAIAIETAMRKGELLKVTAKDYRPADQYLFVPDTKNGENRKVPLSTNAIALLDVLVKGLKPTDKIFPISSSWLAQCFDKAKQDAGLANANLRLHDGRHEAATRLSEKLSNVLELSAVTGHKSLQSLKRYYNPKPADLAAKLG